MTEEKEYRSTAYVPLEDAKRTKARAQELGVPSSQIPRLILTIAIEQGSLPKDPPSLPEEVDRSVFAFALSKETVKALGGEERARDYVRWVVMEGLWESPLAPQK